MRRHGDGSSTHEAQRLPNGYWPGSIVRVACEHFVTYDAVEFRPGPYLNMIVGPNGTGKSTVVCAIALGLGWKPSVLGRAKDVASYVKLGHTHGWVEVELQGRDANISIRRVLFRESNSSDWMLNGVAASAREVNHVVSQFNIEVGNLCAFLPQDRVADFAAMTPSRLLQDTQHAAGHAQLTEWHMKLIEYGNARADVDARLAQEQAEHDHLEERNAVLERDVRRYEERIELEKRVAALEVRLSFAKYYEVKEQYDAAHAKRDDAKRVLERVLQQQEPLEVAVERAQEKLDKAQLVVDERRKEADEAHAALRRLTASRENIDTALASLTAQEKQLEAHDAERQASIEQMRHRIAELEAALQAMPEAAPLGPLDTRLRTCKGDHRVACDELREMDAQYAELHTKEQRLNVQLDEARRARDRVTTMRHQRLQIMARADRDTFEAVQWLQAHQGLFERPVHEPVLIVLQITRPEAARAIETCLSWPIQRTFVCETRADYDLFTHELIDKRRWRLNVVELESNNTSYAPPIPPEELPAFGFDAYALDCVDAPPEVLKYLCSASNLHAIPLAFHAGNVKPQDMERRRAIRRYIAGDTIFTTTYSSYGQRLPQTMSRVLKPLRNFAQAGDSAERERTQAQIVSLEDQMNALRASIDRTQVERMSLQQRVDELARVLAEVRDEHTHLREAHHTRERLVARLEAQRASLAKEEHRPSIAAQRRQIHDARHKHALELARVAEKSFKCLESITRANAAADIHGLAMLHVMSDVDACKESLRAHKGRVEEAEHALREILTQFSTVKAQTKELQARAQQRWNDASEEVKAAVQESDEESAASLEAQLERANAQLDVPWGVGPGVMETFRTRKERMAELKRAIDAGRAERHKLTTHIERLENQWLPALESLIAAVNERFSAAFARLGCAGEVRLARDEDHYEKWGIDILVKFRDTERLQLLTGQRQSGGERSLSTILYLLSLTELSRTPFSLVDEINQGMDPRAERAVHDQMVAITCTPEAGQYFLITPKLLPGLQYHELMKVLIINNGDWLPERLSLLEIVQRKRRRLEA